MQLISHEEAIQEAMKDPEFNREYKKIFYTSDIATAIYKIRKDQNLTQKEFAKKYGISKSTLKEIEYGNMTYVTFKFLEDLLERLDLYISIKFKKFEENLED